MASWHFWKHDTTMRLRFWWLPPGLTHRYTRDTPTWIVALY